LIERNARILARSPVFLENGVRLRTVAALLAHALEAASGRQPFQSLTLSASCFLVLCKANGAALDEAASASDLKRSVRSLARFPIALTCTQC